MSPYFLQDILTKFFDLERTGCFPSLIEAKKRYVYMVQSGIMNYNW
jgi:hypothetical protein